MEQKNNEENNIQSTPPEVYGSAHDGKLDKLTSVLSRSSSRNLVITVFAVIGVALTAFTFAGRPTDSFESPPTLSSPEADSTVLEAPTFTWQEMPGAGGYELSYTLAADSSFEQATVQNIGRKSTSYTAGDLAQGEYIWRVRATGRKNVTSPWSETWGFTFDTSATDPGSEEPPADEEPVPPGDDDPVEEPPADEEPPAPPITEFPDPLWHADADTIGENAWKGQQEAYPDRLSVVDDPLGQFGKVYQAMMKDGDLYKDKARAEWYGSEVQEINDDMKLVLESPDNLWFGWRSMVSDGIFAPSNWSNAGNIMQIKGDSSCGGPALGLTFKYGRITLRSELYGILWNGPLVEDFTGDWRDFVLHVNFSKDKNVGYVELWYQGVRQAFVDGTTTYKVATMCPNDEYLYLKMGIYRDEEISGTDYHWVESPRIGESYESVIPR